MFFLNTTDLNFVCLTETHQTEDKFSRSKNLEVFSAMREPIIKNRKKSTNEKENNEDKSKKGGGLEIIMRKGNYFNFSKRENKNKEFLEIE